MSLSVVISTTPTDLETMFWISHFPLHCGIIKLPIENVVKNLIKKLSFFAPSPVKIGEDFPKTNMCISKQHLCDIIVTISPSPNTLACIPGGGGVYCHNL